MTNSKKRKNKHKIAVRVCAGCYCQYDRRKVLQTLKDAFADTCEFEFSYFKEEDGAYDRALLISGCDSHCAKESELIGNVVIDHNNWERAVEVFAEETGWR